MVFFAYPAILEVGRGRKKAPMKTQIRNVSIAAALVLVSALSLSGFAADKPAYKTYKLVLSGKINQQGHPCAGMKVSLDVQSASQGSLTTVAQTKADGSYTLAMSFIDYPNKPMDWKLTVQSTALESNVVEGRQILTDETRMTIAKSLTLVEDSQLLAYRY
jgi:hypothetical protein